jgi:hypothetical protein
MAKDMRSSGCPAWLKRPETSLDYRVLWVGTDSTKCFNVPWTLSFISPERLSRVAGTRPKFRLCGKVA